MKIFFLLLLSIGSSFLMGATEAVQCDNIDCRCREAAHCGCLSANTTHPCECPAPVKQPDPR